ncbi:VWA domain-containing protein [Dactylosporangium cerinum]|uniref:VWA domain-containing protein n=1 Tax=Dactylosporangium cerinum TaxID=1434730 RepID=A0ABV9WC48_9ACTN
MTNVLTAEVYQNRFLPAGSTTVNAVLTVAVSGPAVAGTPDTSGAAQVIMVDCSGSMASPRHKIAEAIKATTTAIDTLPDGVAFGIIAGRSEATMVYPQTAVLAVADPRTRAEARTAVAGLIASGGTALGSWLSLANVLFAAHPAAFKHAIMLTDGQNQHETPEQLAAVLRECEGRFICDTRGVGDDWSGAELRAVASALLGTADGLPDPTGLAADFRAMTEAAMARRWPPSRCGCGHRWTPGSAS